VRVPPQRVYLLRQLHVLLSSTDSY
jgi:hypothetical protein